MKPILRLFALTAVAVASLGLESCSTGMPAGSGSGSNSAYPSVTGNWQILSGSGVTSVLPPTVLSFRGSLVSNGSTVTGVGTFSELSISSQVVLPAACLLAVPATVSGTVDTSGNLNLVSSTLNGGVATMSLGTVATASGLRLGTIVLAGGTCAFASNAATGELIPSISGTYSGTLSAIAGGINNISSGAVSLSLTQASTPTSTGQFPLTGSVTFASASPACSATSALTGSISGSGYQLQGVTTNQLPVPGISVLGAATATSAGGPLLATVELLSGACSPNGFQGVLSK